MIRSTFRRGSLLVGFGIFFGVSLAAVAQETPVGPPITPQTQPNSQPQGVNNPNSNRPSGAAEPVNATTYKIGAADVLNIQVWGETRFSGPVTVQENGSITIPLVGQLKAGDMTPIDVEKEITEALAKYVRQPLVTVTVAQVGSKQYYMDGGINRAGKYSLVVPTTILEAISEAGGFQPFANQKKIYVLRGSKRIPFNYKDVIKGKHMDQNILLQPGDHVIVPM